MNTFLKSATGIIRNVLIDNNLEIVDIFEYGMNKIEFMVKQPNKTISISLTIDMFYDFMVFNDVGDEIQYSNTIKVESFDDLKKAIRQDLMETRKQSFYIE